MEKNCHWSSSDRAKASAGRCSASLDVCCLHPNRWVWIQNLNITISYHLKNCSLQSTGRCVQVDFEAYINYIFPAPLNMKRNISINLDVSPMAASSKEERMKNAVNDRIASSLATNVARISLPLLQLHHLVSKTRIVPFLEPDAARRTLFPRSRPASQMSLIAKSLGQAAALENRLRALRTSRSLEIAMPRRILL